MFNIYLYIKIPTTKIAATNYQSSNLIEPQPHLIHKRNPPPQREANHIPRLKLPNSKPKPHKRPKKPSFPPKQLIPTNHHASEYTIKLHLAS